MPLLTHLVGETAPHDQQLSYSCVSRITKVENSYHLAHVRVVLIVESGEISLPYLDFVRQGCHSREVQLRQTRFTFNLQLENRLIKYRYRRSSVSGGQNTSTRRMCSTLTMHRNRAEIHSKRSYQSRGDKTTISGSIAAQFKKLSMLERNQVHKLHLTPSSSRTLVQ